MKREGKGEYEEEDAVGGKEMKEENQRRQGLWRVRN